MKPPIEYRQMPPLKKGDILISEIKGFERMVIIATNDDLLAHKKAMKAAQMRRYRARKKGAPPP